MNNQFTLTKSLCLYFSVYSSKTKLPKDKAKRISRLILDKDFLDTRSLKRVRELNYEFQDYLINNGLTWQKFCNKVYEQYPEFKDIKL